MRPRPSQGIAGAAEAFGNVVAQHAKRRFDDGRKMLAATKRAPRSYADQTLIAQINDSLGQTLITRARTRFVGQWEWCVELERADGRSSLALEFGPTVVAAFNVVATPPGTPDFTKVFIVESGLARIPAQTDVSLVEVLNGLQADDHRLRDAVLAYLQSS